MGVKYVNDFEFPKSFGFSGSAGEVHVRPHTRRKLAKGGRVMRKRPPLKPSPEQVLGGTIAAGAAAAAYDKLRRREEERTPKRLSVPETMGGGVRRRQERELGLKKGGVAYRHGGKMRGRKDC